MHRRGGSGVERLHGCAGDLELLWVVLGIASGARIGLSEPHFGAPGNHFGISEDHFGASEIIFRPLGWIRCSAVSVPWFVQADRPRASLFLAPDPAAYSDQKSV